jgi:transcriptional regulator GlxA family with amidase domain
MLDLKHHTKYSERSLQLIFKKHLNKSPFEYIEEQNC